MSRARALETALPWMNVDDLVQLAGVEERAVPAADIDDGAGELPKLTRFIILPQRTHGR